MIKLKNKKLVNLKQTSLDKLYSLKILCRINTSMEHLILQNKLNIGMILNNEYSKKFLMKFQNILVEILR